jgi:hypothetical protein
MAAGAKSLGILFFPAALPAYMIAPNLSRVPRGPNGTMWGISMLRLTPPTITTFLISVVLAAVAVAGQYVDQISNFVPVNMFWLAVIAYVVLFVGNIVRGI